MQVDFYELAQRILALFKGAVQYTSASWNGDRGEMHFDSRCGGAIERHWPDIYQLCEECGCEARFEWQEGLLARTVLDTASAAPVYSVEPVSEVRLLLTHAARRKEVA